MLALLINKADYQFIMSGSENFDLERREAEVTDLSGQADSLGVPEVFRRMTELTNISISNIIELRKFAEHPDDSVRIVAETGIAALRSLVSLDQQPVRKDD